MSERKTSLPPGALPKNNCEFSGNFRSETYDASIKLPERNEGKECFSSYGCYVDKQHPFYRTSSNEYGWYPPDEYTVPCVYYPTKQTFSSYLAAAGMYRNHSLNTSMDPK